MSCPIRLAMLDTIFQVFPPPAGSLEDISALPDPRDNVAKRLLFADGSMPPHSLETYVWGFWNTSSLFIFFSGRFLDLRIADEEMPVHLAGRTTRLWEKSDVFEVMIGRDCARTGRYREFQVAPDARWLAADVWHENGRFITNEGWEGSIRCTSLVDGERKIWKAGMEIPWSVLNEPGIEGGWQCNFYRATGKFHGDELLAWRQTGYGEGCFHRPHLFGTIELLDHNGTGS